MYCSAEMLGGIDEHSKLIWQLGNDETVNVELNETSHVENSLRNAYSSFDKALFINRHSSTIPINQIGSTSVSVIITKSKYFFAHIGDSRAVLVRGGKIEHSTMDHKIETKEEYQRVKRSTRSRPHRGGVLSYRDHQLLTMTRAFGDFRYKRDYTTALADQAVICTPSITTLERHDADDFIVVASDGLWNVMSNFEVVEFIHCRIIEDAMEVKECIRQLNALCFKKWNKGTADNITIMILKL